MKIRSAFLVIREMRIKTPMRYHLTRSFNFPLLTARWCLVDLAPPCPFHSIPAENDSLLLPETWACAPVTRLTSSQATSCSIHLLLLLLSRFSRVRLFATPETAAYQAPPTLGFSRQEHWSGLPFPSPMWKSEKWKWSHSVMSDSSQPHGLQPTRLLRPWDFLGKSTGVGCHCLLRASIYNCW